MLSALLPEGYDLRVAFHRWARPALSISAVALSLLAAPALGMGPQTFTDPVGDNCRDYTTIGYHCGPDITQVVFSAPGDGNLHVDLTYASLPLSTDPALPTQVPEFVDVGVYPLGATTANLFGTTDTYRFAQTNPGEWTLSSISGGFNVVGSGSATVRPLGIDLAVPLLTLGLPWTHRYAVNAGSAGETIPEHPDLAPNSGLFSLVDDTPVPVVPPAAAISALSGIRSKQRGRTISGSVAVSAAGDLTIEALAPVKSKLTSIGKLTKRGLQAGKTSFRLVLAASARKRLAGRRSQVTLRLTLKPTVGVATIQTRTISLTVPR